MRRVMFIFFLLSCFVVRAASAEVYECDGKWTNKPCPGKVTKSIEELGSSAPIDESTKLLRQKTSMLHELRMKNLQARENFDIRYELGAVESFCLKTLTSLEDCDKKVKDADAELDKKISSASLLASQKRSIELQEEANRLQQERNKIEEEKATVVIQERQPILVIPRDRPFQDHGGSYGGSVNVQGNIGGSNVHVGVSGHEHSGYGNSGNTVIVVPQDQHPRPQNSGVIVYDKSGRPRQIDGVKPGPFAR